MEFKKAISSSVASMVIVVFSVEFALKTYTA